jgi:putative endonuclease
MATKTAVQAQKAERPVDACERAGWFLYLLECRGARIYTGIAIDVEARFAAHVAGRGARYTRANPPERVLKIVAFDDRAAASRAEYRVKRLTAAQKRAFVEGRLEVDFAGGEASVE